MPVSCQPDCKLVYTSQSANRRGYLYNRSRIDRRSNVSLPASTTITNPRVFGQITGRLRPVPAAVFQIHELAQRSATAERLSNKIGHLKGFCVTYPQSVSLTNKVGDA